jgi:hypothetical protein
MVANCLYQMWHLGDVIAYAIQNLLEYDANFLNKLSVGRNLKKDKPFRFFYDKNENLRYIN